MPETKKQQPTEGPRFPELSRLDDLKNPFHRLWGIRNYCRVLRGYQATTERYWAAQDSAATRSTINWTSLDPITREYDKAQIALVGTWQKVCEDYHGQLCQLCNAAFPLMPDVVKGLKVLRFGAERLHYNRQTDWKAFEDDLSAMIAQANVLLAEAEGSLPDYPTKPTGAKPPGAKLERSRPMSKTDIAKELAIPVKRLDALTRQRHYKMWKLSRKVFQIRVDKLAPEQRLALL